MKTSNNQTEMLLEFMEKNGDISTKSKNARGRAFIQKKWTELTRKLNSDGAGATRDILGWRKVWTDLKNNTKKKFAKVNAAINRTTGGGPPPPAITTQDRRVMAILGVVAATGMPIPEIGFDQDTDDTEQIPIVIEVVENEAGPLVELHDDDNIFDGFNDPPEAGPESVPVPPSPVLPMPQTSENQLNTTAWKPPPKKRKLFTSVTKAETASRAFLEAQERDREYERDRDSRFEVFERERIRQRDVELQLQSEWLALMRQVLKMANKFLDEKNRDESRKDEV